MTHFIKIASAAVTALSLSLSFASVATAQDKMSKDEKSGAMMQKNDGAMTKDAASSNAAKGSMSKDAGHGGMKKDDGDKMMMKK